jgi:hypothetical protein
MTDPFLFIKFFDLYSSCIKRLVVHNPSINSLVIRAYLNGKTRDDIAKETGISTGKVSNMIKEWKNKIGIPIVEELRDFTIAVKKSGISIGQCAEGYRMVQLMENLGITDDGNEDDGGVKDDLNNNNNSSGDISRHRIDYNEFSTFVQEIYMNCKNFKIKPAIIFSWIKDLFSCYTSADDKSYFITGQISEGEIRGDGKKLPSSALKRPSTFQIDAKSRAGSNFDDTTTINPNSSVSMNNITSGFNSKQKNGGGFLIHSESPFISQISGYISQKKKECIKLENYKKALEKDIKIEESKKDQIESELGLLKLEQKYVMTFIDWFYGLKRELWERYFIKIEDFEKFTSVINDFKKNGFDAPKIMEKYISSITLDDKIKQDTDKINTLYGHTMELNNSVLYLQDQVNRHIQTMNIYYQLEGMNFGLQELKQLLYAITEIAESNKISTDDAVSKFLDDIEKEYDNKLGLEKKVKELKDELALLNNQVIYNRAMLQSQPSVGPILSNLFQKGMTEQDILVIGQIVDFYANNIDFSNSSVEYQNEIIHKEKNKDNSINNRSESWKMLIDELKKYGNIKIAIKEQRENLDRIQKEISYLHKQKQDVNNYLQIVISFINTINSKISCYAGLLDHLKNINNKINLSSRFYNPLIILVYKNTGKDNDEENKEDKNE